MASPDGISWLSKTTSEANNLHACPFAFLICSANRVKTKNQRIATLDFADRNQKGQTFKKAKAPVADTGCRSDHAYRTGAESGFKFTDGKPPQWAWNASSAQHFISEFGLLVVDGAIRNSVSASPLSKRGRTAIGVTKAGEFVVYVVTDNETYARRKTAKELANKMLSLGCTHAVNLDGGGSSQVADNTGVYTSGRYVPGFLCI